jgi:formiminotetrahydrofolate cyclodeaminase
LHDYRTSRRSCYALIVTNPKQPGPDTSPFTALPFERFLDAIGSKTPTPGGGAVASAVGAIGAALGSMVVAYSVEKKSLAAHRPELEAAVVQLARAREVLLLLADADMAAYGALNVLQKLPETDPARVKGWADAVAGALHAPSSMLAAANDLLRLFEKLRPITNEWLKSDLAIAAVLAEACARAAAWNVKINLPLVSEADKRARIESETDRAVADARTRCAAIERACGAGG